LRDAPFDFVLGRLEYDPATRHGQLHRLKIAHAGGCAIVRGSIRGDAVTAELRLLEVPIEALARGLAPDAGPVEGTVSGQVTLAGTTDRPTAELELELHDARGFGLEEVEAAITGRVARRSYEFRAAFASADIDLDASAKWDAGGLLVEANVTDQRGPVLAANLRSEAAARDLDADFDPLGLPFTVDAQLFERSLEHLPIERPAWLDGGLVAAVSFSATNRPRRPLEGELHATLKGDLSGAAADEESCERVGLVDLRVDGSFSNDRARANLEARLGEESPRARAELEARLPLTRMLRGQGGAAGVVADLEGRIAGLDLGRVPLLCEIGAGPVHATVKARGLGTASAEVRFEMSADGARLGPTSIFDVNAAITLRPREGVVKLALS
ncbi:MAG: hypothetical protein H5U40_00520, partial [Polyangiaceae bacterium]|nr:hypothetical protein [Polyangiaceae bacterium]